MARETLKQVANCRIFDDGTIRVDNVRVSYPHLDKPYSGKNDDGSDQGAAKYGLVALLPKGTHKDAARAIQDVIDKLVSDKQAQDKKFVVAKDKKFLRNGDDTGKAEAEGHYTISANEVRQPTIRNKKGEVLNPDQTGKLFYGGCWASILIRPWLQDNKWGKRANAGLVAVQFMRDDDPFGEGRINDEGAFDDLDEDGWSDESDEDDI